MTETPPTPSQTNPLLAELGILPSEVPGKKAIGILMLLGQGPVQDAATKVKMEVLEQRLGEGSVGRPEANSWMRMIARAGATLYKTGEVDAIIPSGRATGGDVVIEGKRVFPSEAQLMETIVQNLTKKEKEPPHIIKETEARNTIYNFINSANIIDERGAGANVTIVCAHFHKPRIKVLASIFGFDPGRVVSAEEVLAASASLAMQGPRGEKFNPLGFDRQATMLQLLRIRLGDDRAYFDRKKTRAVANLTKVAQGREADVSALVIEEEKSVQDRMMDERRWVRGLAMEEQYVVPLLGQLKNDQRLGKALAHFPGTDIDGMDMSSVRKRLDPAHWSWKVVSEAWRKEPYPQDVLGRLQKLGLSREDREGLSNAQVPEIQFVGTSQ
jgi:uncharacterized SAM-binding protein YcdF (DUF218 family)